jgi:ATP-binding cassette subfamily C protein LapB
MARSDSPERTPFLRAPRFGSRRETVPPAGAVAAPAGPVAAPALADPVVAPGPADPVASPALEAPAKDWNLQPSQISADAADPLLGCLVAMSKHFGRPHSAESLVNGLPLEDNRLTLGLVVRAAERADLSVRIVKRRLQDIPEYVLPVILLLKNRSACVLFRRIGRESAEVLLPESGDGVVSMDLAQLRALYEGHAAFVKPRYHYSQVQREILLGRGRSWFWGTLVRFWRTYIGVMVAAAVVNLVALASPMFIMNVYDRVVPNQAVETLWVLALGIGLVFGFDFLFRLLRAYLVDNAGKRADVVMSARIFEHVLGITMRARPGSSGAFANQLRDFEWLREFFTSATVVALVDLPFLGLFILVIYLIAGPVWVVPAAAAVTIIALGLLMQLPLRRSVRQSINEGSQKHGVMIETISALDTVKSLGAEGRMQREWEKYVGTSAQTSLTVRFLSGFGVNLATFVQQFTTVAVVVYGVYRIIEGELTVGGLIATTILTGRCMAPLGQLANLLARLNQSVAALKALNRIMALPIERPLDKHYLSRPALEGRITFENVSFSYPESQLPALREVSFDIRPGERVAIIGPVGSGKSTIARLLIKLYEPEAGSVLVDGTDIRQLDPADIRKSLGVLLQDVVLFHGTVRDNISMAAPHADDQMIFRAAQLSGVHDFISQQPQGYDMQIGERGQTLSGGQRQCIALARALLPNPPVLVLDEPTSMMDIPAENAFKARMRRYMQGKTLVLVTHRPSLLDLVDRIIVMGRGRLVADGPRDEILNRGKGRAQPAAAVRRGAAPTAANTGPATADGVAAVGARAPAEARRGE